MSGLGTILFLFLAGPGFLLFGIRNLRTRAWHDGVPAAELLIDSAIGAEPPSRNATDRRFSLFNAWMMVIFGAFFSLCLAAVVISQFAQE